MTTLDEFNPDWDAMAVMVNEQQRMAKRIEELEATPQPVRDWRNLSDGVMCDIAIKHGLMRIDWIDFARAIEAALKEKNA